MPDGTLNPEQAHNTPESLSEIQRFTPEAREALGKKGFVIYELTGQSIETLKEEGKTFGSEWHQGDPIVEAVHSRRSEVAIDPKHFFLSESNNKTLAEQEEMIKDLSLNLLSQIPSVEAVMGQFPDYLELGFMGRELQSLFSVEDDGYRKYLWIRTKTQFAPGSLYALVGRWGSMGPSIAGYSHEGYDHTTFVAPLIVPGENK